MPSQPEGLQCRSLCIGLPNDQHNVSLRLPNILQADKHNLNVQVTSGSLLGVEAPANTSNQMVSTSCHKSSCFPGSAWVQTREGKRLMRDLKLGDEVIVEKPHSLRRTLMSSYMYFPLTNIT